MRFGLLLTCLCLLLSLYGSTRRLTVEPITAHPLRIESKRLVAPVITTSGRLRYVDGWSLSSRDKEFGGLSSLIVTDGQFLALGDAGALFRFRMNAAGQVYDASIAPLPSGCARDNDKRERDSESITRDPASGNYWIGFEWRNAICRSDPTLRNGERLSQPPAMLRWSKTGGPEAMLRLGDGRFLIFAEFAGQGGGLPPLLVADRDPTAPDVRMRTLRYAPPEHHFSPTDAAALRDGRLLVLNRRFEPPARFSARLSLLEPIRPDQEGVVGGETIASFGRPGLTSNFEGLAVSYEGDRTFVWLLSDDNFMWIENSYLLKFELIDTPPAKPSGTGGKPSTGDHAQRRSP